MKLFLKIFLTLFTLLSFLGLLAYYNQDVIATVAFDQTIDKAIQKVEQKVPGLSLNYEEKDSAFGQRDGVINWSLDMDKIPDSLRGLSGATNLKLDFSEIEQKKIKGSFEGVDNAGTISSLFYSMGLPNLHYKGDFEASYTDNTINAVLNAKTDGFTLPISLGNCVVGSANVHAVLLDRNTVKTNITFEGIECVGNMTYNSKPNFMTHLRDLELSFISNIAKKDYFADKRLSFASFLFDFSTIYAIGFEPQANVKDKSLRDSIAIENFSSSFDLIKRNQKFKDLVFDSKFVVKVGMPSVKENINQMPFIADNAHLKFDLKSINLAKIKESLTSSDVIATFLDGISNSFTFKLHEASFYHKGAQTSVRGYLDIALKKDNYKESNVNSLFDIKIGRAIFDSLPPSYSLDMKNALEDGRFIEKADSFVSTIKVVNNKITVNDRDFSEKDLDDGVTQDPLLEDETLDELY